MSFIVNDNKNLLQKSVGPETYLSCSYRFSNTAAGTYALVDQQGNYLVVANSLIVEALLYSVTGAQLVPGTGTTVQLGSVPAQASPNNNLPNTAALTSPFGAAVGFAAVNLGAKLSGAGNTGGTVPLPVVNSFLAIAIDGSYTSGTVNIVVKVVGRREL